MYIHFSTLVIKSSAWSLIFLLSHKSQLSRSRIMTSSLREKKVKTNGIWLNVAEKGDTEGPLVLLLHGFPETWYSWRHQIDFLSSHGYHVVAPDLRGYGDSDSLPSHESYTVSHLVADVIGLLDHYGTAQVKYDLLDHPTFRFR